MCKICCITKQTLQVDKIKIITEELEKVDIKYLGLPFGMRQAMIRAMGRSNKPIARVLIKKECRETHGVLRAFNKACKELKKNYVLFALIPVNKDVTWTIELNTSKE